MFTSTLMTEYTEDFEIDHITFVLPNSKWPTHPEVWVMNKESEKVQIKKLIEPKKILPIYELNMSTDETGDITCLKIREFSKRKKEDDHINKLKNLQGKKRPFA